MALELGPAHHDEPGGVNARPLAASLRWGLGWTVVAAARGAFGG